MSHAPIRFEPITREQIRDYAEASGDHNRIHLEDLFAKEAGLPGVIAHGMLSMGLGGRALFEWGFDLGTVKSYQAKFKDMVFPGDQLTATITRLSPDRLQVDFVITNQNAAEVMTASASWTASVPR